ncbi:MAG: hypothetical protein PHW76_03085 [Alphaproteobacteria bacterium]|nr:hypothetical protein [Alphaproteobacteria bacterium]
MSGSAPSSNIGRVTAAVLGFVVFFCVSMIGGTGYLKYRLDRAEAALVSVDNAPSDSQNAFNRLRQEWGYGGFLGLAQNYLFSHDLSGIAAMKEHIKAADAIVAELPTSIPVATKKELASVASLFDLAMEKIAAPAGGELSNELIAADLSPLYAAVTALDTLRASTTSKTQLDLQNQVQLWATLLTVVSWLSLILAAGCATAIYMVLRDKKSAPMHALAQSIQNMAHGDMRSAIWGIERQDMVGELARAIDIARYNFSHLPDVSLVSEQGPVRLRFEGGSRSLFEGMMKAISTDSETIREQANALTNAIKQQKEAIGLLTSRVETILDEIEKGSKDGNKQIMKAIAEMAGGAENLKNAHAHTSDQLARLIPAIQDRAQGLAEITQITGKQLTHTLQSLASSEITLKANADQVKETLDKLSSTADDLGQRLFGAINLLQAGGKVLNETTENIRTRWSDASISDKLSSISQQLSGLQDKLDVQADSQFGLAKALEETSHRSGDTPDTLRAALAPLGTQISGIMEHLGDLQQMLNAQARSQEDVAKAVAQASHGTSSEMQEAALNSLTGQLGQVMDQLASLHVALTERVAPVAEILPAGPDSNGLAAIEDKIGQLVELDGRVAVFVSALPGDLRQALKEEIQSASAASAPDKVVELQKKIEMLLAALSVSPHYARMIQEVGDKLTARIDEQRTLIESKLQTLEKIATTPQANNGNALPQDLQKQFLDQWFQMSAQIEASRSSMLEAIGEQLRELETRLAQHPNSKSASDREVQLHIEKQTEILTEMVSTLSLIDAHMQQIKPETNAA